MTNFNSAQQAATDALTAAALDRQLYVLQGVASIDSKTDHEMIKTIFRLHDEAWAVGALVDLDAVLAQAEADALAQALLG